MADADFIPDDQFTPDTAAPAVTDKTPDFIPDHKFTADSAGTSQASPDFVADKDFQPDDEKYGTSGQQAITALEGAAQGFAGPAATLAETKLLGVKPEDIRLRAETNPWTHGLSEAGGFGVGALTGTGEAAAVAKIAGAATAGMKSATLGAKLLQGAAKGAAEMGLIGAGDEATKAITEDPNQTVGSAASNTLLSGLLGFGGGGVFTGVGMAMKAPMTRQVLKDFAERTAFRHANIAPNELMEKEFNDAISAYHGMNDEVLGPQGLKAQAIEKALPEAVTPKINEQVQELFDKSQKAVGEMFKNGVPERYVNKFTGDVNAMMEAVTAPNATVADHFDALNDFKQTLQGYSKGNYGPFSIPSYHEAYDFLNMTKNLGRDVRLGLEDSGTWGKAAILQKNLNKSWSDILPAVKDAQSKFMEKIGGEYVPSTQKFSTYINQGGKATSQTTRQKMMGNLIDGLEKHFNAVDDLYNTAGVMNPHPPVGMSALRESISRPSLGSRLADTWYEKIAPRALGEAGGAAAGSAVGHAVLPGYGGLAGGYLGKEILGPAFQSIIKGVMEMAPHIPGYRAAIKFGTDVIKGQQALTNAATNLFIQGAKTLPDHLMSDASDTEKLDKQLKHYAENPGQMMNLTGNLSHYMPAQAQSVSQHAATAVTMLNAQRPQPKNAGGVLDTKIQPSKAQQASYQRNLQIANQPLTAIQHIKDGTLLPQDVVTLKAIYPAYYAKMSQQLLTSMNEKQSEEGYQMPYKLRQSLSLFLGKPLDSTMTPQALQAIQSTFTSGGPPQQPQQGGQKKGSTSKLGKVATNMQTADQARQARQNKA